MFPFSENGKFKFQVPEVDQVTGKYFQALDKAANEEKSRFPLSQRHVAFSRRADFMDFTSYGDRGMPVCEGTVEFAKNEAEIYISYVLSFHHIFLILFAFIATVAAVLIFKLGIAASILAGIAIWGIALFLASFDYFKERDRIQLLIRKAWEITTKT